jgi:hypothetical protein
LHGRRWFEHQSFDSPFSESGVIRHGSQEEKVKPQVGRCIETLDETSTRCKTWSDEAPVVWALRQERWTFGIFTRREEGGCEALGIRTEIVHALEHRPVGCSS